MKVYVFLAEGFETVEAFGPIDVLRRAGVETHTVSLTDSLLVESAQGVTTMADCALDEIDLSDGAAVILPGGFPGFKNLAENEKVGEIVRSYYDSGRLVCAICGAPTVLKVNGVAEGRRLTCHYSVIDQMNGYQVVRDDVVKDHNLITSSGAGHSVEFGLAILGELLKGDKVDDVKRGMELK